MFLPSREDLSLWRAVMDPFRLKLELESRHGWKYWLFTLSGKESEPNEEHNSRAIDDNEISPMYIVSYKFFYILVVELVLEFIWEFKDLSTLPCPPGPQRQPSEGRCPCPQFSLLYWSSLLLHSILFPLSPPWPRAVHTRERLLRRVGAAILGLPFPSVLPSLSPLYSPWGLTLRAVPLCEDKAVRETRGVLRGKGL